MMLHKVLDAMKIGFSVTAPEMSERLKVRPETARHALEGLVAMCLVEKREYPDRAPTFKRLVQRAKAPVRLRIVPDQIQADAIPPKLCRDLCHRKILSALSAQPLTVREIQVRFGFSSYQTAYGELEKLAMQNLAYHVAGQRNSPGYWRLNRASIERAIATEAQPA